MAVYAIGDIQGCYDSLQQLLDKVEFDPASDRLWFTGDLVNRGPRSADVLRFVANLGERAVTVLGNHDLHLLAVAIGGAPSYPRDTFEDVLRAPDSKRLLTWLAKQLLFYHDRELGYSLVHAGLLPQWDILQAEAYAREIEAIVAGPGAAEFFRVMYGDNPDQWSDQLAGWDRIRLIVNAFTRLRFCHPSGRADYRHKGAPGSQPPPLLPWFQIPGRRSQGERIVFGHWSLLGLWDKDGVVGLDTGCLWGRCLTALRLSGGKREFISVRCPPYEAPER